MYEHLEPGEALVLFRERAEPGDKHAVSYRHGDVHLGYVPGRHRWIADAIDDGLRLFAIVETVKTGWIFPPARNIRPHADCRSPELPLVSIAARHTNGALYAINSQRRARAELVAQRQREAEVLTGLKTE